MNPLLCAALSVLPLALAPLAGAQTNPLARVVTTVTSWSAAESDLGFQVNLRGHLLSPVADHHYDVLYQVRVHTQKGELGPILGDAQNPNGRAIPLGEAKYDAASKTSDFDFAFDLLRKDLTLCTPLTKGRMVLRIEPQVYDQTDQRFLTAPKSEALIAVAMVGDDGKVHSVVPFSKWFAGCCTPGTAPVALELLASLDAVDLEGSAIIPGFEQVLSNPDTKPAQLCAFLAALPARELALGKNNLRSILAGLAQHADTAVRDAVAVRQKAAAAVTGER